MEGWFGANFFGSSTNTEFKAQDGSLGSGAGRGVISFGANGSSDRALGALPTSNQIPSFGIVLFNASSDTYQALDVSFIGELAGRRRQHSQRSGVQLWPARRWITP